MQDYEPGQVISPQSTSVQPTPPAPSVVLDNIPTNPPYAPEESPQPLLPTESPEPVSTQPTSPPASGFVQSRETFESDSSAMISWQAAEFLHQDKNLTWYGAMVLGAILLSIVVYIINRDILTSGIIFVALCGLAYVSGRKPQERNFTVDYDGVRVGQTFYPFSDFRCFSVSDDSSPASLVLTPLKRFMPAVNVLLPAEKTQSVIEIVSSLLPMEQHKTDVAERLVNRFRF